MQKWRRHSPETVPDSTSTSSQYLSGPVEPSRLHLRGKQVTRPGDTLTPTTSSRSSSSSASTHFDTTDRSVNRSSRRLLRFLPRSPSQILPRFLALLSFVIRIAVISVRRPFHSALFFLLIRTVFPSNASSDLGSSLAPSLMTCLCRI